MKQFFKFVFASCLGTILAFGVIFLIASSAIAAIGPSASGKTPKDAVLHLTFDGSVPELTDNVQPSAMNTFSTQEPTSIGLNDVRRLLDRAKSDSNIKGILIQTQNTAVNPTVAYQIAKEIENFKESKKTVWAYGDYFTQSGYIIACTADSVFLNPNGLVDIKGYGTISPYYEEMGKKFGIEFDVFHAGKYKSAVEPYYRNSASPENRYQTLAFLDEYHNALADHIAKHRNGSSAEISNIITNGLSMNVDDASNYNLVDQTAYIQDVKAKMKDKLDVSKIELVGLDKYLLANPKGSKSQKNKIAVIYAEGTVAMGGKDKGAISMDVYDKVFDRILKNDKIKGVVLRVNSPGGSAFTSDLFWNRIAELKEAGKYVVSSFGTYAASGGYYIAANSDKIVSEPTTLTGSIGVFAMMPNFSELSEDKLGINWDTISTGKRAFIYSPFLKRSKGDNLILQGETNRIYQQFKTVVSKGRDMTMDNVQEVAQGRVWSGLDALEVGLVDTLGGIGTAIDMVANHLDIDQYKILEYPIIKKTFFEELMTGIAESSEVSLDPAMMDNPYLGELENTFNMIHQACQEPQARLPITVISN